MVERTAAELMLALPQWVSLVFALVVVGGIAGAGLMYRMITARVAALELRYEKFAETLSCKQDRLSVEIEDLVDGIKANCKGQIAMCREIFMTREAGNAAIERTRDDVAHRYELINEKLDHLVEMWNLWAQKNGLGDPKLRRT